MAPISDDKQIAAYKAACDDALRQALLGCGDRAAPSCLHLPFPKGNAQFQVMESWLNTLYRRYRTQIRIEFRDNVQSTAVIAAAEIAANSCCAHAHHCDIHQPPHDRPHVICTCDLNEAATAHPHASALA